MKIGRSLTEVKGISFRENGRIVDTENRPPVPSVDELPCPAWDPIKRDLYTMPFSGEPFLMLATARGCPFPCNFCADATYYGKKLRLRSPSKTVDEMEHSAKEYGILSYLFWSESFTLNRKYALEVAQEIIKRGLKVRWVCNSRADHVDQDMLRLFRKAGCWLIGYGVESGNQKTLDAMRKGITLEQIEKAVRFARQAGIQTSAHSIVGYPGETEEDILRTVQFVKKMKVDFAQFYCAVPFPGSELFERSQREKWLVTDDWTRYEQNFSVLRTPQLSETQVMDLRRRAYRKFFLRPATLLHGLKIGWRKPSLLWQMIKSFLTWI